MNQFGDWLVPSNLTVLKAFPGSLNKEKLANSEDPDQTAPEEQSDLDLHLFAHVICPNVKFEYS